MTYEAYIQKLKEKKSNYKIGNWKKTYEISNFVRYENKKYTIGIWQNPNEVSIMDNSNTMNTVSTRTFKTRAETLKFAKKFMENNKQWHTKKNLK